MKTGEFAKDEIRDKVLIPCGHSFSVPELSAVNKMIALHFTAHHLLGLLELCSKEQRPCALPAGKKQSSTGTNP